MNRILWLLSLVFLVLVSGCGGGGGGGSSTPTVRVTGNVLSAVSGGSISPSPSVQIGSRTVQADVADGSFIIEAPKGATEVLVITESFGTFRFVVPPLNVDTDLGQLWVGPQKVSVRGTVVDAVTGSPIEGASVTFGGRRGTTDAQGRFLLTEVAYAPNGAFDSIEGKVQASGYFAGTFSAQGQTPSGGIVEMGTVVLTPLGDDDPPPGPYNLWGQVLPSAAAPGTVVTLSQNGTPLHQTTVGSNGRYFFWVPVGTYRLDFVKGNLNATTEVSITESSQVVQKDVTLSS